ncbi:MAG TPA: winged helix-turn-helix domain-containing protein, partial [Blastocatellia bacterium]|nr:winged helix-turn-helix domain-containing protein [Blastocatellia bacterium]
MQADISEESLVRFDGFEMALKSGELRRRGRLVKLQPQPFKVLALLVAHPGQIITREEIQQQIWEGDTFVDFEHGLNFCIKQIRAALGDSAQSPRYIETLPRRGYRFIAEIDNSNGSAAPPETLEADAVESDAQKTDTKKSVEPSNGHAPVYATKLQEPVTASKRKSRTKAAFILAGIFAVAAAAWFWSLREPRAPAPPSEKVMLAVLPFENLSADDEDYFSDGLTEEMIARLGQLEPARLGVIARTSAMTYKGSNKDIRSIGRELGVDYVLEGSVRREADRVRITAQLIKVSDQTHLWAESYDRSTAGALTVQSEVASRIASSLAIELLPSRAGEPAAAVATNPEAHDAYLRGRYLWNKGATADIK